MSTTLSPDNPGRIRLVLPSLKDPRVMLSCALTLWTVLGQTVYFFNRDVSDILLTIATACVLDFLLIMFVLRQVTVPLSAYITGLSIGLLLESFDWRVYVVAAGWAILSKYLIRDARRHFFNPSNFAIVMCLLFSGGVATVAPGSQWGAHYPVALAILCLGLLMMKRVKRLDLALAWLGGYVVMGLARMAMGQGGLVFVLGPMTGAEFALFTFSMMPDPKASPPTPRGRIVWGLSLALMDGVMRYFEIRYSMFYALFIHTAALPLLHAAAARAGFRENEPWRLLEIPFARRAAGEVR